MRRRRTSGPSNKRAGTSTRGPSSRCDAMISALTKLSASRSPCFSILLRASTSQRISGISRKRFCQPSLSLVPYHSSKPGIPRFWFWRMKVIERSVWIASWDLRRKAPGSKYAASASCQRRWASSSQRPRAGSLMAGPSLCSVILSEMEMPLASHNYLLSIQVTPGRRVPPVGPRQVDNGCRAMA